MRRAALLACALLCLNAASPVEAQRRTPSVRAELAAVLLQSRRYEEAAHEYRILLQREPGNVAHRLGLARALAWGKHHREAEHQLVILSSRRPNDREIEALLRSVRQSFEPRAQEAALWLEERPHHLPYRRALARALVREGKARAALPHYELLLAADTAALLRREAIDAHVVVGDYERAAELLRRSLARAPRDTAVRHAMAGVLARAHYVADAHAQYDTLIAWHPSAPLLLERARLNASQRDLVAAEADVRASLLTRPGADAYVLLGDLHRWRGEFAEAHTAYDYARALEHDARTVAEAFAQLAREERPVIAFLPEWADHQGWRMRTLSVSDNEGMSYAVAGARRTIELPLGFSASPELELRRMAERPPALGTGTTGVALGLRLAHQFVYGPLLARLGGHAGIVQHGTVPLFARGLAATGWLQAWAVSFEYSHGPAYPTLLTRASIEPPDHEGPLRERSAHMALGGPLAHADLALSAQHTMLSDDNRRSTVQAVLHAPLSPHLSALVSAHGIWFDQRSTLYWDPIAYRAAAAGLELAHRSQRGFSWAARMLAGPAHTVEEVVRPARTDEVRLTTLQLNGGIQLMYRAQPGELGAIVTYGSGRTGAYRRLELGLNGRLAR
jgi:tetratricopeptide (TPR) repeat protein